MKDALYCSGGVNPLGQIVDSSQTAPVRSAPLAQLAEHRTLNPQVPGSSPGGRTTTLETQKT